MAAVALRHAGRAVTVLERTPEAEFRDQGSGLGVKPEVVEFFDKYNTKGLPLEVYVGTSNCTVLNQDGSVAGELGFPAKTKASSWYALVSSLRTLFTTADGGAGELLFGSKVTGIDEEKEGSRHKLAVVYELDGVEHRLGGIDLVVGADGATSTVRRLVEGAVPRPYAGYAFHRGRISASDVSPAMVKLHEDATVVQTNKGCSAISYLLPAEDGAASDLMVGYYAHHTPEELRRQLVGVNGHQYGLTMPLGQLSREAFDAIQRRGEQVLCPQMLELLRATRPEKMIIQAITDIEASQNCYKGGKVLLISEATAVLRPHAISGTAQAAFHALRLADLVEGKISTERWSDDCLQYSRILQKGSRDLGEVLLGENSMEGLECWQTQFKLMGKIVADCMQFRNKLGTST